MRLSPRDREMLLVHVAAELAKKRRDDNVNDPNFKLNYPEAMSIITSYILEQARLGRMDVAQLEDEATKQVGIDECMDGVPDMMRELAVEATFPDGTKMVAVPIPIKHATVPRSGRPALPVPPTPPVPPAKPPIMPNAMVPGEIVHDGREISFNTEPLTWPGGRDWTREVTVENRGDRAIQVGSHFHFYEANSGFTKNDSDPSDPPGKHVGHKSNGLVIMDAQGVVNPDLALGYRLDIPAGTAVRFEPGCKCTVRLVSLAGDGTVWGLSTRGTLQGYQWT